MRRLTRCLTTIVAGAALWGVLACEDEEEEDPCESHCNAAESCAYQSHQPFSYSECERECNESLERADSVGCENQHVDFLECQDRLPCSEWSEIGDACASEINSLNGCMGGYD